MVANPFMAKYLASYINIELKYLPRAKIFLLVSFQHRVCPAGMIFKKWSYVNNRNMKTWHLSLVVGLALKIFKNHFCHHISIARKH